LCKKGVAIKETDRKEGKGFVDFVVVLERECG